MFKSCISQQLWRPPASSLMKKRKRKKKAQLTERWKVGKISISPLLLWLLKDYWGTQWRQGRCVGHITHVITTYKCWTAQNDKWQVCHSEGKKANWEGVFSAQWSDVIAQHLKKKLPRLKSAGYSTQAEGRGCTLLPWKQKSFFFSESVTPKLCH